MELYRSNQALKIIALFYSEEDPYKILSLIVIPFYYSAYCKYVHCGFRDNA